MKRPLLRTWVPGHPKTKGSLTFKSGHYAEENVVGSPQWREHVADAVKLFTDRPGHVPYDGPVEVRLLFRLDPGRRPRWRWWPWAIWTKSGDLDKLIRNVLDALASDASKDAYNGRVFVNDNQVTDLVCKKVTSDGMPGQSGVFIEVYALGDEAGENESEERAA